MGAPAAPHHIFAGVSSILASQEQQTRFKIQTLIVAVYMIVTTRLAGTETAPDAYQNQRNLALGILNDAAGKDEAYREVGGGDIDSCMRVFKEMNWTQMDWFENITPGAGVVMDEGAGDDTQDRYEDDEADESLLHVTRRNVSRRDSMGQDYLQAGLGTMVTTSFLGLL